MKPAKSLNPLSEDKKIKNLILAAMLWNTVSPKSVDLSAWSCGTQACFGGWLASWPEFANQGVGRADDDTNYQCTFDGKPGAPCVFARDGGKLQDWEVAEHLFGAGDLFNPRTVGTHLNGDVDPWVRKVNGKFKVSDHKLVAIRLENQFAELTR